MKVIKTKKFVQRMTLAVGRVMPGAIFLLLTRHAEANPTGMTVQSGSASASLSGSRLTVTAGNNAVLNWQSFNIAAGETTIFRQPSAQSIVWNHIGGQSPSQIYGSLQANGIVVLLNSSGFYFGPNSYVSAAGLVVSTANCTPPENAGGTWTFNGPPPLASVVNYGQIQVGHGGSCFLIADQVENHGSIEASKGGTVGLAAGETVMLSERPDGRGMSMNVTLPQGSVDNYGTLVADAGTIALSAKVVNQNGFIQANSVKNENGVIELVASDQLNLGANSQISAKGDDSATGSAGGNVTLKSGNIFSDVTGSEIVTTGGAHGGNGGNVEVSAPNIQSLNSTMDATAQSGFAGGIFSLDPVNIVLGTSGSGTVPANGTVPSGGSGNLFLDVNTAFENKNFSQILLQASGNIYVGNGSFGPNGFTFAASPGISWDLSSSTGENKGQLVLQAGGNITMSAGSSIHDENSWNITLEAGYNFATQTVPVPAATVPAGTECIIVGGTSTSSLGNLSYIQTAIGSINLIAAQDITVNYGRVTTTGTALKSGGNITAHALAGSINTGDYQQGYLFNPLNPLVNPLSPLATADYVDPFYQVGGISTTGGGDVSLIAGDDVTSFLPTVSGSNVKPMTAGTGAYGSLQGNVLTGNVLTGNVTIIAGGDVTGNYLVANGAGNIFAGVEMDASGNPIKNSAGNYVLGTTGDAGDTPSSPNLSLSLISGGWNVTAANNINLLEVTNPNGDFNNTGSSTKHEFNYGDSAYVDLTAGNMVQLGGSSSELPRLNGIQIPVILPGILNINAGAGGVVLNGDTFDPFNQIILFPSKSGSLTINTTDGGSLQAGSFDGNNNFTLYQGILSLIVSDSGNTAYSFDDAFGLNDHNSSPVHANNETPLTLNIAGDMNNILLGAPEAAQITVGGNMTDCRFQGMNLADETTSINVGGAISSTISGDGYGYEIGGGGNFDITAGSINLGSTYGIVSWGVGLYTDADGNYPLAKLFNTGANINVTVSGDLDMTSSSIASYNGGNILINAGGNIEVGSADATASQGGRGIYTTTQGDVTVVADGDIDLNRSRIATYDGGNVTVLSSDGNINAGSGGGGFVVINSFSVDPTTQQVTTVSPTVPGSGILASTYPFDKNQIVGNILVETPNGSINANAGGILQSPYNRAAGNKDGMVEVLAGYELEELVKGKWLPVYASELGAGTIKPIAPDCNIDASGSGIIGENIVAQASGTFKGAIFSQGIVNLTAPQISGATVLGTVVSTSGSLGAGDTIIGTVSVNTGGATGANVLSADANGGGSSFAQGVVANATSSAASASANQAAAEATKTDNTGDEDPTKKKKGITLARKVSRVTVLLPGKN